jgi:hypothetical protein
VPNISTVEELEVELGTISVLRALERLARVGRCAGGGTSKASRALGAATGTVGDVSDTRAVAAADAELLGLLPKDAKLKPDDLGTTGALFEAAVGAVAIADADVG